MCEQKKENLQSQRQKSNASDFHRAIRYFQKEFQLRMCGIKENIINGSATVLMTWKRYFQVVWNCEEGITDPTEVVTVRSQGDSIVTEMKKNIPNNENF